MISTETQKSTTLEPDLQLACKGLAEEHGVTLGHYVLGIAQYFDRVGGLDFRRLRRIILTDDYAGELASLSGNTPSGENIGYTNEEYAQAVGKVIILDGDHGFEFVLVLKVELAALLLGEAGEREGTGDEPEPSAGYFLALHFLHHEFCHVHDFNKQMDASAEYIAPAQYSGRAKLLGPLAEACWSEYFANYMASSTATTESVALITDSFKEALVRTKREFDAEIRAYRRHGDLSKLIGLFNRHGAFLAKCASYVLGYVDGLNVPLTELSAEAATALTGSYFEPTWNAMYKALVLMREQYPQDWKSLGIYQPLTQALEGYCNDMGLILSELQDGNCRVDIPLRPESTPRLFENLGDLGWLGRV